MKIQDMMKDHELIHKVFKLATEERRIGVEILDLLKEIERRKAYAELGYDGLFSFCVKELKYSEAQAYRRIQAMRAMSELPELRQKVEAGALTVTTVSQVQTHLKKLNNLGVKSTRNDKLTLFQSMENCSAKEVEHKFDELLGTVSRNKLVLDMSLEMQGAWDQIKNQSAHSTHGNSEAILEMLMREWLNAQASKTFKKTFDAAELATSMKGQATSVKKDMVRQNSRYIRVAIKQQVRARDQDQCQNCGSEFALQIDHRLPHAKGGTPTPDNLRLLCRSCNLHHGIKEFGTERMRRN